MLVFGSWISIINGHGGFNDHLANPGDLEMSAPSSHCKINKIIDNLGEIEIFDLFRNLQLSVDSRQFHQQVTKDVCADFP